MGRVACELRILGHWALSEMKYAMTGIKMVKATSSTLISLVFRIIFQHMLSVHILQTESWENCHINAFVGEEPETRLCPEDLLWQTYHFLKQPKVFLVLLDLSLLLFEGEEKVTNHKPQSKNQGIVCLWIAP